MPKSSTTANYFHSAYATSNAAQSGLCLDQSVLGPLSGRLWRQIRRRTDKITNLDGTPPARLSSSPSTAWKKHKPKTNRLPTRLHPCQLPSRAARQLPDQSTILRVESSSTDDLRLRGARPLPDKTPAFASEYGTLDHHGRGYRGIPSIRLGPSLKDHVERPRRRPSNPRKPAVANDFGELGLTRLRTQAFAHFLVQ